MALTNVDWLLAPGLLCNIATMRINIPISKLALFSAAFCAAMLAFSNNASALTFGDGNDLGKVRFDIASGDSDRLSYVNHLIDMAPGSVEFFNGQLYQRSLMNPGPGFPNYPNAVLAGLVNGTGTTINLGPTAGVYQYLFANYNILGGSEVWYVGNLSGIITIPANSLFGRLCGWTLFGGEARVPDGGTTVMLLGAALGALGMARRFLKS
jgi:VPDSG-CTERM motif